MQNPEIMQNLFSSFGQLFGQGAQPSSQPSEQPSVEHPADQPSVEHPADQPSDEHPSSSSSSQQQQQQPSGGLSDLLNNPEFRRTWVPRFWLTSRTASLMQNPEIQNLANSFRSFMGGNASTESPQPATEEAPQREGGSEERPESRSEAAQGGWEGLMNNPLVQQA